MAVMTNDEMLDLEAKLKEAIPDDLLPYRAVSRSAILAAVLGFVSLLALIFPSLLVLPVVGFALGIAALATIRRYPNEYTGRPLALTGIALCSLLFIGSATLHTVIYLTEVPEGYTRITFNELQPDPEHPELPIPPQAFELSGKPVFIKGYMHPGVASMGKVNHFILVPDMGTCCFGGQPKPTDMVEVAIVGDAPRLAYSTQKVKLAGKFNATPYFQRRLDLDNVCYQLEASYAK